MKSKFPRCKGQSRVANSLLLGLGLVAGSSFLAASAQAVSTTWTAGSGTDVLWSTSANWSNGIPTTANPAVFSNAGTAAVGTVTNEVSANLVTNGLTYNETTNAHTTQIDSGVTLSLTVTGTTPLLLSVAPPAGTAGTTTAAITGPGTLAVSSPSAGAVFGVASQPNTVVQSSTLDMSGLSTFTLSLSGGSLAVGTNSSSGKSMGTLSLAKANTITAASIVVGTTGSSGAAGGTSTLNLGQMNTIQTDTINVGSYFNVGALQFASGLTGATATITNQAGTGATNMNIGFITLLATSSSTGPNGTVDFTGGAVTANLGTVNVGIGSGSTKTGTSTATLNFGAGSAITAATVNLAQAPSSVAYVETGTINQSGGTATITTLTMGSSAGTGTVKAIYNLSGGTLSATTIAAGTVTGTATPARNINWSGGTIQNITGADATIGAGITVALSGTGARSFNVTDNAARNLTVNATLSGATGISKDGVGMLTIAAANPAFSGGTTVNVGALTLTTVGTLGTGNVTLANTSGVVLTLGNAAAIGDAATLAFGPSSAIVGNGTGTEVLGAITDSVTGVTLNSSNSTQSAYSATDLNTLFGVTSFSGAETFMVTTAVPEPSTWVAGILCAGCAAFSVARRRARLA